MRLALLVCVLGGCVALGGMTAGQSFQTYGLQRATFDLQCPAPQISMVAVVGTLNDLAVVGNQVGVTGCGRQAVYVNTNSGWILNSASQR